MHKKIPLLLLTVFLLIVLGACNNNGEDETIKETIGNPTPKEILSDDKDADIFLEGNVVYTNAQDIDWINEKDLTIGKEIGEIKKQSADSEDFENFTATKLPVGTKIFEPKEDKVGGPIYIVKTEDEEIRYLGLVEG